MVYSFAWADANETAFGPEHEVEDEKIFSYVIEGAEGGFDSLTIEILNPRIGLLAPGRQVWCWFSRNDGTTSGAEPLFFGRLVGIPSDILAEVVTLVFTAEPIDYAEQKHAYAQANLKVAPYYDPIALKIEKRDDPDAILEGYTARWHTDRVTHEVTPSDILDGEGGLEVFTSDDAFYDSVEIQIGQPPIRSVSGDLAVTWSNASAGSIDFGANTFSTYTGAALISDWPKPGANLGGGWSVLDSSATDNWGVSDSIMVTLRYSYRNNQTTHNVGDTMSINESLTKPLITTPMIEQLLTQGGHIGVIDPFNPDFQDDPNSSVEWTKLHIPLWSVSTRLILRYEAGRTRTEHARFTLVADFQQLLTSPQGTAGTAGDMGAEETITIDCADVGLPVQQTDFVNGSALAAEAPPIGDPSRNEYFPTDRGQQTLQYGIALARAKILASSRAVQISWDCTIDRAVNLSCNKNASLADPRLPGGGATGKIIAYRIEANGDEAREGGNVTIGCAIGYGGTVAGSAGDPVYAEDDYVEAGYQVYDGQFDVVGVGDIAYSPPVAATNPDGMVFPLTKDQVVLLEQIHGSKAAQEAAIAAAMPAIVAAAQASGNPNPTIQQQVDANAASKVSIASVLEGISVWYELQLKAVNGEGLEAGYDVLVSRLAVPQMIDLEAPATP